jgi:aminopeptidase N
VINLWQLKVNDTDLTRLGYLLGPQADPVVTRSWEFEDYLSYRCTVYFKASLILETLRNYLGPQRMDQLLREYFRLFQFKHPSTRDFLAVVDELEGEELTDWLEPLFYKTGICDYQLKSIGSVPVNEMDEEHETYKTTVELRRLGEVVLPVEVEIELDDGKRIRKKWDGKERWHRMEMRTDSKIKSALLDPENKMAIEIDVNNNSLMRDSSDKVMMKLAAECLFWLENWMHLITCF